MRIKLHTTVAIIVLAVSAAWVITGKYSFVGSEMSDDAGHTDAAAAPAAETTGSRTDAAAQLQTVAFTTAEITDYQRSIRLSGQTEADKQVVLVARTSGTIANLPASEGDRLEKGDLVMSLDGPERYVAVESAKAQLDSATHQAESNQQLRARGALPELQLEASLAAREAARSAYESAKAAVDRLEVHAPFAGIVDRIDVEVGSWVDPGVQVASLLSLDPIVVVGEIGERDLQSVTSGTAATVTFGDGTKAEGTVRYVRREASGLTRTFPVEVTVANPDGKISAGMSAEIRIAVAAEPALVLPRSAITLDPEGKLGVRTLTEDRRVAFQPIQIVDDTPEGMILTGVPAGTRIIVSGQDMVSTGQQVAAVEAGSEAGTPAGRDTN